MVGTVLYVVGVVGGVLAGFWMYYRPEPSKTALGWVYFISARGGATHEPPSPVKVGFTHRDPRTRLPEIERMSSDRLELLWSFRTDRPEQAESLIHAELRQARHHGEWYDRDATLAYVSYLRGEVNARARRT